MSRHLHIGDVSNILITDHMEQHIAALLPHTQSENYGKRLSEVQKFSSRPQL